MNTHSTATPKPWALGLSCFFAYTVCYAGRGALSAIMPEMIRATAFTKDDFGLMGSAFFIAYGLGQIANGLLGDRISARIMVFLGLLLAGATVYAFPLIASAGQGVVLWGLCGLLLSMLWGPLSKVIAENMDRKWGQVFMMMLNIATIAGTMAAYLIATLAAALGRWHLGFQITGIALLSAALFWFITIGRLQKRGAIKPLIRTAAQGGGSLRGLRTTLLDNAFAPMIVVAIINGIIRNAVAFWIPTYIAEKLGADPVSAAGVSSILPLVGIAGTLAGMGLLRRLGNNEFRVSMVLYVICTIAFTTLWALDGRWFIPAVAALFLASASMTAQCNMVFGIFALRFADTGRVSAITGFLNFSSYASASIASTAFVRLVAATGWGGIVLVWVGLAVTGLLFCALAQRRAGRAAQPSTDLCNAG